MTLAVREILNEHGYALAGTGTELVEIHQALFRWLYIDTEIGLPAAIPGRQGLQRSLIDGMDRLMTDR